MTDRELLEMAAKAARIQLIDRAMGAKGYIIDGAKYWDPLTDDGDALRLAVALKIDLLHDDDEQDNDAWVMAGHMDYVEDVSGEANRPAATRRAIVRAAAEIGKRMP